MDILIPDNWLRDYLKTKASKNDIAKYISLCGPSVERILGEAKSPVYLTEVTTNRVDSASVYGFAREAAVILPRFKISARFNQTAPKSKFKLSKKVPYLKVQVDKRLCPRFTAILIENVKIGPSPEWMQERLIQVGVRPINNVVDISNYTMHDLGQPVHTFDYDKISGHKMVLRESKKGEEITTLDGKKQVLPGGDIVIEDGEKLIDLAGIMGGENSAVDKKTQNVLLFVQTYNPVNIRKTSMALPKRTEAAVLFEKGIDSEGVELAVRKATDLFVELTSGIPQKTALDIYPTPYKPKTIEVNLDFINRVIGVGIPKGEVKEILTKLGFKTEVKGKSINVEVPSFRAKDVEIAYDIVEEVARIYGYFNLPSKVMSGKIPDPLPNSPFEFEMDLKRFLAGLGGNEVYTLSLVSSDMTDRNSLKLRNPLGSETEYLRTTLRTSLVGAANTNSGEKEPFHLFEMSNVYIPTGKETLPNEVVKLGGVFVGYSYREAKGVVEAILDKLHILYEEEIGEMQGFLVNQRIEIKSEGKIIGEFGVLSENDFIYYEFDVELLRKLAKPFAKFKATPKYPPQIEDITIVFPDKTKIGEVLVSIKKTKLVSKAALVEIYDNAYTFRVWYQDPEKTLNDSEVEKIREKVIREVKQKFGGTVKG